MRALALQFAVVSLSPRSCHLEGVWLSPGASTPPASSQPGPPRCNNTMSPWCTLPHLFSQHACEVGRGGDCPHFTEEEVEAHRGQVTCPRSQTAAKLEWALEQAHSSPGAPVAGAGHEDVSSAAAVATGEQSSCTELAAGLASPSPSLPPTSPCTPGPSQLRAHDTLGVGLGGRGERRMTRVKK